MKPLLIAVAVGGMLAVPLARHSAYAGDVASADADNTQRNIKDRGGAAINPMDQGSSDADMTITQHIRQAVVGNDALSMNAKNVKIITVGGVVTLRGPVKSAEEKTTIAALAAKTTGVKRVDDQLEIERN